MPEQKEESTAAVPLQDKIYQYDEAHVKQLNEEKPWKTDPKFFKRVRINVLAATKMVKHAVQGVNDGKKKGGLPTEIMGLLVGKPDGDSYVIMDCVELPVEGSETRVVAEDEKVFGFMTRMQDRIEETRKERFIGWYHSHPFDVGQNSNCFFSGVDVNTQLMWQLQFGKWVGIVVDPLRCLAKQKVELMAFMAYPPTFDGNKTMGPDGVVDSNPDNLTQRWGAAYDRYYKLKHTFFMGSLVKFNLEMMSRKHLWIRQLSSSAILEKENRDELPKRILNMTKTSGGDGLRGRGLLGGKGGKGKGDGKGGKGGSRSSGGSGAQQVARDLSIEQCLGHSAQLVKDRLFNTRLG